MTEPITPEASPPTTTQGVMRTRIAVGLAVLTAALGGIVGSVVSGQDSNATNSIASAVPAALVSYPNATNTGVPSAVVLTTYTGATSFNTCGAVIDGKTINGDVTINVGNGFTDAQHPCITIRNSLIKGKVNLHYSSYTGCGGKVCGPLLMTDSEIAIPEPNSGDFAGISQTNFFLWRVNIHGARSNIQTDGYTEVHDSWVHNNWYVNGAHMGAFLDNGNGGRPIVVDHNTLACILDGTGNSNGGCSGDINFYGDFATIDNIKVTDNYFVGSSDPSYCAYTGANQSAKPYKTGTNLKWSGNVWQRGPTGKCGWAGAVFDWANNSGNSWCNNKWDDGSNVLSQSDFNCATPNTTTTLFPPPPSTTTTPPLPTTTTTTSPTPTTSTTTLPPPTTTTTTTNVPTFECTQVVNRDTHAVITAHCS